MKVSSTRFGIANSFCTNKASRFIPLLEKFSFTLLITMMMHLLTNAQTQTYNVTSVVNMGSNCGTAGPYTCTAGTQIGFDWTDVLPTNAVITSVSIQFREGVECSAGTRSWFLNGVNQGNVTTAGNACACTVGSAPAATLTANPSNYVRGGTNTFRVTTGSSCFGFYPNWSSGTVYGIVTVQYTVACPAAISGTPTVAIGGTTTLSTSLVNGGGVTYSGTAPIIATRVFTASSTFTTVQALTAEVLVVGGGGGGGSRHGGGGGGGGVQYNASLSVPANTYTVTVGSGGAAGWYGGNLTYNGARGAGDKGGNSSFGSLLTALGGGGGRTYDGGDGSGASGGGGTGTGSNAAYRTGGTATQGFAGGNGSATIQSGGGGGGAGAVGASVATGTAPGGAGGNGVSNSITGTSVFYGGGGGGGGSVGVLGGVGGTGGGGHGGDNGVQTNQTAGTANTGGGGGGCRSNGDEAGSAGGSGVVIIKYTAGVWSSSNPSVATINATTGVVTGVSAGTTIISYTSTSGCAVSQAVTVTPNAACPGATFVLAAPLPTGGTITSSGTDRIHTFTSSGTFSTPYAVTTGRLLAVGGGGGGGLNGGGGGGAGGVIHNTSYSIASGNTAVTVGAGGASASSSYLTGTSGGSSSFGSIIANGGGGGASRDGGGAALAGGCGGGGGGGASPQNVAGAGNQGSNGGTGTADLGCNSTGAGGGGAGGAGANGTSNVGGNGGVGVSNNITGTAVFYAGGGGGGTTNYVGCGGSSTTNGTNGTGGAGGGGNGESTAGAANTGGGGGAERAGGSGVVIVRYNGGTWSTSNASVAIINSVDMVNGTATIQALSPGTATINFTNANGTVYPITVTVNTLSSQPTGITGTTTVCAGNNTTLTVDGGSAGAGASAQWYTGSCGGTSAGTGNSITVSPSSTTAYYVRYVGTCNTTPCATTTVTINQPSVAPTSISGTSTICTGSSTTLTSAGGSLGANAIDVWFSGSCDEAFDESWNTQPYASGSTTLNSVSNGIINVTSTTNDPMIFMENLGSFNPNVYRYINIRYRVTAGTAGNVEIFFYNTTHNYAVGGETGFGALISDGAWHVLSVDMQADPDYTTGGNILGWRYDWATNSGVTMDIDFISLSSNPMIGSGASVTVSPTVNTTYYTKKKGSCNNTTCASQSVTVRPTPTANVSGSTSVCQNASNPNITFTNPMALPVTVTYNVNGGSNATINIGANTTATTAVSTSTAGTYAYNLVSVAYQSAPNCSNSISETATVTVRPTATASLSGTTTVCQNASNPNVTFTNPTALPVTVTYNVNGGSNTTVNIGANATATVAVSTSTAGTYAYNLVSVAYQSAPNCSNSISETATVTVRPTPTASISGTATVCQNASNPNVTFTNPMALPVTVTYNVNGGSNTTINVGANTTATTAVSTSAAGSYAYNLVSVAYQSGQACSNSISETATVTVRPTPTASISGTATVCQNASNPNITFTNPMALPVTVTYNVNGGSNTTVNVGANTTATVAVSTSTPGTYIYNLVSVAYQSGQACSNSISGTATITVNPVPAGFVANILTTTPLCLRGTAQIQVPSSTNGATYQLRDNTTNIGSPQVGDGSDLTFNSNSLTATNANYAVVATNGFSCSTLVTVGTITVDAIPAGYANNGDVRTCYVNTNSYVEFRSTNGIIMSINSNGQNLGNVTVTEYAGSPVDIQACGTYQPWYVTATLGRHWVVQPQIQPTSPVSVRLYFDNNDYTALQTAANANSNPNDDVTALGSLDLTKYSNTTNPTLVDGSFANNCSSGTSTVHTPTATGNITALNDLNGFISSGRYVQYSFTGFSELWLSGTNNVSPLPIKLASFTATCNNGKVNIDWVTSSEINNQKFIVERSGNMQQWEEVISIPGAGSSNEPLSYAVMDERPLQGISYYRLTQRDFDGTTETFEPVSLLCYSDGNGNAITVYPNPAMDRYTITVYVTEDIAGATMRWVDVNGKVIMTKNVNLSKGDNTFTFEAETMQPGTYLIYLDNSKLGLKPVKLIAK